MNSASQKKFAIVFTDMEGSSDYWRKLDSAFLQALSQHDDMLLKLTEKHGGSCIQTTGDGFFLKFETPDAALDFAHEALKALEAFDWTKINASVTQLRIRIGIHYGSPVEYAAFKEGDYRGADVNKAARVMDTAYGGTAVLSGEAHYKLTETKTKLSCASVTDWGTHELKGVGSVRLWQPIWDDLQSDFGRVPREKRVLDNFLSPRVPNESFLGREKELHQLHRQFRSGRPESRRQLITGTGGVGKTELALAYAARYFAEYDQVLYCNAENRQKLEDDLLAQAGKLAEQKKLNLTNLDRAESLAQMKRWLANNSEKYLLILDNVEEMRMVVNLFEQEALRGHLLMTSRVRLEGDWDIDTQLELDVLSPGDATELLIRLANRDETNAGVRTEATALAEALGCLPLAIVVAGGYLNFHSKTTFEEYRTDFEKRCSQFFGVPSANSDNAVLQFQIVAAAWDKTLEKEGFAKVAVFGL